MTQPEENRTMARGVGGQSPSNVQSYLAGVDYPASKNDLVKTAKHNGAPEEILALLEGFEQDQFGGPQEVMKAYGRERQSEN
jgi:uncharacterized protein DUF2795